VHIRSYSNFSEALVITHTENMTSIDRIFYLIFYLRQNILGTKYLHRLQHDYICRSMPEKAKRFIEAGIPN
jgi:hypothetical protein